VVAQPVRLGLAAAALDVLTAGYGEGSDLWDGPHNSGCIARLTLHPANFTWRISMSVRRRNFLPNHDR
jgi:hypothetical protein